jgi:hypothetical protein
MTEPFQITPELVTKLHAVLDHGLVKGVGVQEPGKMCVEAAVCYAMGLPHSDEPTCVAPALRRLKIRLNDSSWSSNKARAEGMRRLAVAQLGSAGVLDEKEFARRCADLAIRSCVPSALRAAAKIQKDEKHRAALLNIADRCEREGGAENARAARKVANAAAAYDAYDAADAAAYAAAYDAADAAYAAYAAYAADAASAADAAAADAAAYAAYAAYAADARDKSLAAFAEGVVQILIEMKAPGCEWLDLNEAA